MRLHVAVQVFHPQEGCTTFHAAVRVVFLVRSQVPLQRTRLCKSIITFRACIRSFSAMNTRVHPQMTRLFECCLTLGACVWPFPRVCAQMAYQMPRCPECRGALCACERAFTRVSAQVHFHSIGSRKPCIAFFTHVCLVTAMCSHVFLQMPHRKEAGGAFFTMVRPLRRVPFTVVCFSCFHGGEYIFTVLTCRGCATSANGLFARPFTHSYIKVAAHL